ncbi:hypothetical protein P692DRAFT_20595724 [Suillus brevipes Sb2]|nr:hypothetical protein P692DRAFT_20595724 [Suillus brevipes Sb2]
MCISPQRFLVSPYNDRSFHVLLVRIVPMVVYASNTLIGFSQAFQDNPNALDSTNFHKGRDNPASQLTLGSHNPTVRENGFRLSDF